MAEERRYLTQVGLEGFPYPVKVLSREDPAGQSTIAEISVAAKISRGFEARWIGKFIDILHRHRETIGTASLTRNILDYRSEFGASEVDIVFSYPFFVEKTAPASKQKGLVRYSCRYSVRSPSLDLVPKILFSMEIPVITTYPGSTPAGPSELFGQLTKVHIETQSEDEIFPEHLVDVVDGHALFPIYSFLSEADEEYAIRKIHEERKSSVVMLDEIKRDLAMNDDIQWFSVRCTNFSMLHPYSTMVGMEAAPWIPEMADDEDL
jgi:GTP cyclohydrolase I